MRTKLSENELGGKWEPPNTIPGVTEGLWGRMVPQEETHPWEVARASRIWEVQLYLFLLEGIFGSPREPSVMILHLITAHEVIAHFEQPLALICPQHSPQDLGSGADRQTPAVRSLPIEAFAKDFHKILKTQFQEEL